MIQRMLPIYLTVLLWGAGFGLGTYVSVMILLGLRNGIGNSETSWISAGGDLITEFTQAVLLVTCAILASRYVGKTSYEHMGLKPFKNDRPLLGTFKVASMYLFIIFIGESVQILANKVAGDTDSGYPVPDIMTAQEATTGTIGMVLIAGPTEETVLVMATVILLSAARLKPWKILTIAVLARVSFHLYYGLEDVFGIAIWAFLAVMLWKVFPNVWALMIGHAVNNLLVAANLYELGPLAELIATLLYYTLLISGIFFVVKNFDFLHHEAFKEPFAPGRGHPAWTRKNEVSAQST